MGRGRAARHLQGGGLGFREDGVVTLAYQGALLEVSATDFATLFYANDPDFLQAYALVLERVSRRKKADHDKAKPKKK